MFTRPENFKMYWKEIMHQCNDIGIGSLGIVLIISVFIGAVSTVQTAYQLVSPVIPKSTIAQIVRDTVILEFAPTLTCIVLAGVVGSKIASELGNMRVSEQIDALEIMGINTKAYLVMPKILAALIMIPLLVIIAMVLGIWGGRLAGTASHILSAETFRQGIAGWLPGLQCFFCAGQGLHFRIYHFQHTGLFWLLCKRRGAGNWQIQYNSSGNQLYHDPVFRLYTRRDIVVRARD